MTYNQYSYSKRNLKFIHDFIYYLVNSCSMVGTGLSIGGGDGVHEDELAKKEYGITLYCLNDINIYNAESDKLPYEDNKFDFVFIKSVIEHIRNTDLFLSEIRRVLKVGGRIFIFTPDYQKQKSFFYDDYTHIKPFTKISLDMALQINGFYSKVKYFWYYKKIWEKIILPNILPIRFALWLTKITGIKYFRWGSDRQLFGIGYKWIKGKTND